MARLLNATGYFSSILAAVCLVLALVAAPVGEAQANVPGGDNANAGIYKASCPNPVNNPCPGTPVGECPGGNLLCAVVVPAPGWACLCKWNVTCICPP